MENMVQVVLKHVTAPKETSVTRLLENVRPILNANKAGRVLIVKVSTLNAKSIDYTGVARIFQQGGGAKARERSDRAGEGVPLPR